MESVTSVAPVSTKMLWAGRIVSALPALMLLMSGTMKLVQPEMMEKGPPDLGWDKSLALGLGILEITCVVIYLIPQTAVLGAILLTGYLGGAVATHVRIHDLFPGLVAPIVLGVLIWGGLLLRDARLRALLPLRS